MTSSGLLRPSAVLAARSAAQDTVAERASEALKTNRGGRALALGRTTSLPVSAGSLTLYRQTEEVGRVRVRKRLIAALIVAAAAWGGIAIGGGALRGQAQDPNDFTIRVRRSMDLPHPLTTGEWRIEQKDGFYGFVLSSHQAEGRACFPYWRVPSGVSRITVGPETWTTSVTDGRGSSTKAVTTS